MCKYPAPVQGSGAPGTPNTAASGPHKMLRQWEGSVPLPEKQEILLVYTNT